jgi:hypothetical protein
MCEIWDGIEMGLNFTTGSGTMNGAATGAALKSPSISSTVPLVQVQLYLTLVY